MVDPNSFEVELTSMVYGGSALGRHDGRTIFVPYGIPSERVTAHITQDKGRFAFAELDAVLDASPERVSPRCPHFGICGGCHWQHIEYSAQLAFKQQIVIDQMRRIGGFQDVIVHPTIASPDPWNYRTHVSLHVTAEGHPGFVATDDRSIIPIHECHIIRPELREMLDSLSAEKLDAGERIRLQVGTNSDERLIVREDTNTGKAHYAIKNQPFQATGGSFFQVNLKQAEALVELVLNRLVLKGNERVLDLYAGVGLFTAFLAERAARVVAVESYPPAVADAEANLINTNNVEVFEGAVEQILPRLKGRFDAAVIDPPRAGMERRALVALVKRSPRKIVYVSCDPATLARDSKRFVESGYRLLDVQPVDMFPQTYHIEAVATFEKS
jgi:23S rRNA (uracil1939-C5)-methyltransferase